MFYCVFLTSSKCLSVCIISFFLFLWTCKFDTWNSVKIIHWCGGVIALLFTSLAALLYACFCSVVLQHWSATGRWGVYGPSWWWCSESCCLTSLQTSSMGPSRPTCLMCAHIMTRKEGCTTTLCSQVCNTDTNTLFSCLFRAYFCHRWLFPTCILIDLLLLRVSVAHITHTDGVSEFNWILFWCDTGGWSSMYWRRCERVCCLHVYKDCGCLAFDKHVWKDDFMQQLD